MDTGRKAEIDRLTELANVGAGHAAGAFAQLVGSTVWTRVPVVIEAEAATAGEATPSAGTPWSTGVFFEFEGCLEAIVGILFPSAASEMLVRRIVGIEEGEISPTVIESALMEVGNILASHVASAIADTLGSRLLPSIPSLAMAEADARLSALIEESVGPDAVRIESVLCDAEGQDLGRLVLVPTRLALL